ncbi:MAG: trigger factor [Phycisphaeraceae bacterium]
MAENEQDLAQATLDEGDERGEQTVTVEDIGPARKRLSIEIPGERITKKIESSFSQLQSDANVPGFRKGRAPMRLLERRFGSAVRGDVKGQLLSECYTQAIEDEKLKVIGEPEFKDAETIELPETGPLSFKVEVEVTPDVTLPKLDGIAVERTITEISDADIDGEIERFRERFGKMTVAEDAKVQENDFLQADVTILAGKDAPDDAEPIQSIAGTYVSVPTKARDDKGHVAGIVVDGLGKKLKGTKAGDTVSISMTGPTGHENEKIKDQPITIRIRINSVQRLEPAAVETLIERFGLASEQELRSQITESLESRLKREQQSRMHDQIADYLLEKVNLELPEGLTSRQAQRLMHHRAMELAYRGWSEQQIEQHIAEMRAGSEQGARKQLKLLFILAAAAEQLNVEVTEAEVNGRIAMLAIQEGRRPEKYRQQMQRSGEIEHLYLQMREQKTLDKILENAVIKDVPAKRETPTEASAKPKTTKKTTTKSSTKKKSTQRKSKKSE